MRKEAIYASLAGLVLFCLIFFASFWYFSPPGRPVNAGRETRFPEMRTVDVLPAASSGPVIVPEQPAAPAGAPLQAAPLRFPTPTAHGEAAGTGTTQASSPSNAAKNSTVGASVADDEERPRGRRGSQLRTRPPMTEEEAMRAREQYERRRREREREPD